MPSNLDCRERISLVLPIDLKERVEQLARSMGISTAGAVRMALIEWSEATGHYTTPERKVGR